MSIGAVRTIILRSIRDLRKNSIPQEHWKLVQSAADGENILGYKSSDGKIIRYDVKENDFVKGNPNIGIATMFKPKAGVRYFNNKKQVEGGTTE